MANSKVTLDLTTSSFGETQFKYSPSSGFLTNSEDPNPNAIGVETTISQTNVADCQAFGFFRDIWIYGHTAHYVHIRKGISGVKLKHTPGPWNYSNNQIWTHQLNENSKDGNAICFGGQSGELSAANLRLIAASPDLYESAKYLIQVTEFKGYMLVDQKAFENALARLIMAVAKAEGDSWNLVVPGLKQESKLGNKPIKLSS